MQNYPNEMENEDLEQGKLLASVNVNLHDPAKLLRGIIDLQQQYRASTGKPAPYQHPFFWHTKLLHPHSSPFTLFVDEPELTRDSVNEAFITYITTCSTNQIAPFLDFQFQKFYSSLKATQQTQPFFEYVFVLLEMANSRGLLYKSEFDEVINWFSGNQYYKPIPAATDNELDTRLDSPVVKSNKRGPYKKPEKDAVDKYFRSSVESAIERDLRNKRVPNQEKIIAAAYKQLTSKVNNNGAPLYNDRTLRQHLPSEYRNEVYGEIHRQVSDYIKHVIK